MKVRAIRLWNVRKFARRGVAIEDIGDGVNVLSEVNEQGKSTCFDALHALLFQPHSAKQKTVRMLRPYSGGSPRIEADIETDQGLYRIAKQFLIGQEATVTDLANDRLIAQADQAEAWISNLTQDGESGPTGLLWVRQGLTDFERGGKPDRDPAFKARDDALSSVAGEEVEALTGGRRMARMIERCQDELEAFVTDRAGQPRKGGPYANALESLEKLREEENDLAGRVGALRGDLDERKTKQAKLARLMDAAAVESRREDRERTAKALEKAKGHASQLSEALGKQETQTQLHAAALENLNRYREGMRRSEALINQLESGNSAHAGALAARAQAQKAEEDAVRDERNAEARHAAARERRRRAEIAERATDARKQMAEQRARLQKAEECQGIMEELTGRGQAIAIPDGAVSRMQELDEEISRLKAKVDASAALVVIDYGDNPQGSILVEGLPLADGDSRPVPRSTRFDIPNIGALTVSTGSSADDSAEKALRSKQRTYDQELDNLGVGDLASLRERERAIEAITVELQGAKAELKVTAPKGVDALRIEITRLQEQAGDQDSDPPDLEKALKEFEKAEDHLNEARAAAATARARLSSKREIAQREEIQVHNLRANLGETDKTLGPEEERASEMDRLVKAEADHATRLAETAKQRDSLEVNAPDLETAEAAARLAASVVERAEGEIALLDREIAELSGSITNGSNQAPEETLAEIRGRREAAENRVTSIEAEIAVLRKLRQSLDDARAAAREVYLKPVLNELRPLVPIILDDAKITLDDDTLVPRSLERNGQDEDISVLSGGTREQLTVLTRLAFARLLARNGRPVPVILDDALVYSDDDRIEKMFLALHRQARDLQIIVFSCRQRAFERLGGQSLHMTEWTPEQIDR